MDIHSDNLGDSGDDCSGKPVWDLPAGRALCYECSGHQVEHDGYEPDTGSSQYKSVDGEKAGFLGFHGTTSLLLQVICPV